jgi:hypothetical protein
VTERLHDERHLKRLLSEYISYHLEDRTHLALGKEMPGCRTSLRNLWSRAFS